MLIGPRLRSQIACQSRRSDRSARSIEVGRDASFNWGAGRWPEIRSIRFALLGAVLSLLEILCYRGWSPAVRMEANGWRKECSARRSQLCWSTNEDGPTLQVRHPEGVGIVRGVQPPRRTLWAQGRRSTSGGSRSRHECDELNGLNSHQRARQ